MSDLVRALGWLAVQALLMGPVFAAYYLGKRAGRRAERAKGPRS